ncbi:MAG: bifunctional chorismate mutase/prephenate dehydratase [Clostridia bacterium]|nr:bifunctional chorismate mutase/prephenate dehydratase [Clostridia bacterium]
MNLTELRQEIDHIDAKLVALFAERMKAVERVAAYKKEHQLPVLDAARERQKRVDIASMVDSELQTATDALYSLIFELARIHQEKQYQHCQALKKRIDSAIVETPPLFPKRATVACQGAEGAYSQLACEKLFAVPNIMYFSTFEGVFAAISQGLCSYGMLPLENSTAGSVNKIYDLMMDYDFSIVRSVRLKIDHSLLANRGAKLADIKEIYSHEQALSQCGGFLKTLPDVRIIPCANTAIAARTVYESARRDVAAFCSHDCAELYNLDCLCESVQDQGNNYTRFICISKQMQIYPGADKTSIMMVLPHKPGSLYKVLARFFALGINLIKLESRPLPNSDFEFMFYFDLETSIYSEEFIQMICGLDSISAEFKYLGSYSEIV